MISLNDLSDLVFVVSFCFTLLIRFQKDQKNYCFSTSKGVYAPNSHDVDRSIVVLLLVYRLWTVDGAILHRFTVTSCTVVGHFRYREFYCHKRSKQAVSLCNEILTLDIHHRKYNKNIMRNKLVRGVCV